MTLKINSAYTIHQSAVEVLAQKNIELNIVKNTSPFVLATFNNPDVVIHPLSKIIKNEFPSIRFCGPECKFPNYEFIPEIGFSDIGFLPKDRFNIKLTTILVNTTGNLAFIKYLESLNIKLQIYGKKCDSLYYYGPLEINSYDLYRTSSIVAVDNEGEALKALKSFEDYYYGNNIISSFNYIGCKNFTFPASISNEPIKKHLNNKNWNTIFKQLFEKMELKYD